MIKTILVAAVAGGSGFAGWIGGSIWPAPPEWTDAVNRSANDLRARLRLEDISFAGLRELVPSETLAKITSEVQSVAVAAGEVIKKCSRETDTVARFGGDEFSLILPDTGTEGAISVAERILEAMREARFLTSDGLSVRQTVSIGVATLVPESPKTAEELIKLADMAMYRVKAAGKDGIHFAQEGS